MILFSTTYVYMPFVSVHRLVMFGRILRMLRLRHVSRCRTGPLCDGPQPAGPVLAPPGAPPAVLRAGVGQNEPALSLEASDEGRVAQVVQPL